MPKRYTVDLTPDERVQLIALTRRGKASARQVTRAHILLHTANGLSDSQIANAAHTSVPTVARIRKRFVQGRVQAAITERYRKGERPKLDLKQEARLIALAGPHHPRGGRTGRCSSWPTSLWSSAWWMRSVTKRYAGRSKKSAQAVAEAPVVPG